MKYFVTFQLKKSILNEIVFAQSKREAIQRAKTKTANLRKTWNEEVLKITAHSFYALGKKACRCDPEIMYNQGDYNFKGRKININTDFFDGFDDAFNDTTRKELTQTANQNK